MEETTRARQRVDALRGLAGEIREAARLAEQAASKAAVMGAATETIRVSLQVQSASLDRLADGMVEAADRIERDGAIVREPAEPTP